jgi:arylsulfatase A-like enzyme
VRRSLAAALALALGACHSGPPPRSLVLIVVDTLRRDHLAAYGYPRETAPTITRVAAEGAVLEGVSPSSWTKPATASLLTGLHPLRHQAIQYPDALSESALTLAERLRAHGYHTLAASAQFNVSEGFGFAQGFDTFLLGDAAYGTSPRASELNAKLLPQLRTLRRPFFLYVHYVDPHAPYDPPTAWDGAPLDPRLARERPMTSRDLRSALFAARPRGQLQDAVDLYDGDIRSADSGIAELLTALRAQDLARDALTIVTSDHGEEFEEHGRMEHGQTLYEEVLRVPLIVRAPGLVRPGWRHGPVSLLDVVPTLADLLSFPAGDVDGVDQAPLLRGDASRQAAPREWLTHFDRLSAVGLALESGGRKLILARGPYRKQLFDLTHDPGETHDLLAEGSGGEAFARLAGSLAARYNQLVARALPRTQANPSPEVLESMQGLGYVGGLALADNPRGTPLLIGAAPADQLGQLGWEENSFAACVRPGEPRALPQLLEGWWPAELGGRWTQPEARVVLAVPTGPGALSLSVDGMNWDKRPAHIRLRIAGRGALERTIATGAFALAVPVASAASAIDVEIVRTPAFIPSQLGVGDDDRALGVFVRSVCLERGSQQRQMRE